MTEKEECRIKVKDLLSKEDQKKLEDCKEFKKKWTEDVFEFNIDDFNLEYFSNKLDYDFNKQNISMYFSLILIVFFTGILKISELKNMLTERTIIIVVVGAIILWVIFTYILSRIKNKQVLYDYIKYQIEKKI